MRKKTALLADKHGAMLESIKGILECYFDSVVMVSDKDSLPEAFVRMAPDLVVLDPMLGCNREKDLIRWMTKTSPKARIIALGSYQSPELEEKCRLSGASAFVVKGAAAKDLITAVENVLDER